MLSTGGLGSGEGRSWLEGSARPAGSRRGVPRRRLRAPRGQDGPGQQLEGSGEDQDALRAVPVDVGCGRQRPTALPLGAED